MGRSETHVGRAVGYPFLPRRSLTPAPRRACILHRSPRDNAAATILGRDHMDIFPIPFMMLFANAFQITQVALLYFVWRELRAMRTGR